MYIISTSTQIKGHTIQMVAAVPDLIDTPSYGGTENYLTKQNWGSQHNEKKN
jgi:hypothetical protein